MDSEAVSSVVAIMDAKTIALKNVNQVRTAHTGANYGVINLKNMTLIADVLLISSRELNRIIMDQDRIM